MGVLAPLFLAALAGLSVPLVLHLVRRTPRGRQVFSSLMFLQPTPPRLTRRSRLDQVLLLLLRLAALALLAFAFARPFFREDSLLSPSDLPRRRVAILLDRSASMQRSDLWQQALDQVRKELTELSPQDDVALYAFADRLTAVVGFAGEDQATAISAGEVVRSALSELQPTWEGGNLGAALAALAAESESVGDVERLQVEPQLVVVSDFEQGNRIDALQGIQWPPQVRLIPRLVKPTQTSNAAVQFLANETDEAQQSLRVRVLNAADSIRDQFFVRWDDGRRATDTAGEVAVYVPPGQSRVVKLPRPDSLPTADRVQLRGDDHEFDNTFYVTPPQPQEIVVAFVGDERPDDPEGLLYYITLAAAEDPLRKVQVTARSSAADALALNSRPQLILLAKKSEADQDAALTAYVKQGGALLLVPADRVAAEMLPRLLGDVELGPEPSRRSEGDFRLLGEIDFTHPLFLPFANPRYNDFTRIHFWRNVPVQLKADARTRALVRFENGDPWLLEYSLGRGRVWGLTSGWRPDDGQLAVSSKFVPLVGGWLDAAAGAPPAIEGAVVNAPVALPRERPGSFAVRTPSNTEIIVDPTATEFRETARPGIYHGGTGRQALHFAVNLPAAESDTSPMPLERLEQSGVRLGTSVLQAQRLERLRQARDTELEGRQQVWRWLLCGAVLVLIAETGWAGRVARMPVSPPEAAT